MENPYQSPAARSSLLPSEDDQNSFDGKSAGHDAIERTPAISPAGTTMPRYMAAIIDGALAAFLCVIVAKQLPNDWLVLQLVCVLISYLGYFQVFEMLLSTTPGKFTMGLKVVSYNGKKCSWRQILIRTLFRLLEVNPLFLGALPAAARILFTEDKQRFGDKVADTIVIFR